MNIFNLNRDKILYFFLLFLEKASVLVFHFYFINKIAQEFYGVFSQSNYVSGILSNILLFGVAIPFVINSSSKNKHQNELFSFFKNLSLIVSIILIIFIITFGDFFSDLIFGDSKYKIYLFVLGFLIISDIVSEYFNLFNRIRSKLITHSKFIFFRSLVKIISLIIPYIIFEDFLLAYLISSISYILFVLFYSKKSIGVISFNSINLKYLTKTSVKSLFKDGMNFLTLFLFNTFSTLLINLILVNQFDVETLAIYSFNMMLASIPISVLSYITFYSLTDFSNNYNVDKNMSNKIIIKDAGFSLLTFTLSFILIYFLYDYIFLTLLNDSYANRNLFIIIFIANLIYMINNFIQFPILSEKKYFILISIIGLSIILNLSYLYFNINSISILTPVIGLLIANFTTLFFLLFYKLFLKYAK